MIPGENRVYRRCSPRWYSARFLPLRQYLPRLHAKLPAVWIPRGCSSILPMSLPDRQCLFSLTRARFCGSTGTQKYHFSDRWFCTQKAHCVTNTKYLHRYVEKSGALLYRRYLGIYFWSYFRGKIKVIYTLRFSREIFPMPHLQLNKK